MWFRIAPSNNIYVLTGLKKQYKIDMIHLNKTQKSTFFTAIAQASLLAGQMANSAADTLYLELVTYFRKTPSSCPSRCNDRYRRPANKAHSPV